MGEAKRRRLEACICGDGKPAGECCLTDRGWHKKPVKLDVHNTGHSGSHASCYLKDTNGCNDKITGEHLVSETVLRVLAEEKVEVSGFPWLKGQKKILTFGSLTANCLCGTHNSSLSVIDSVGGLFFEAFQKSCMTDNGPGLKFLFSGHDVERWLFRTLAALSVSNNFAMAGTILEDSKIHKEVNFSALLEDVKLWKRPLGLYAMQTVGQTFTRDDKFAFGPIVLRENSEIVGLLADIQGLHIGLLAVSHPIQGTGLDRGVYRPSKLVIKMGETTHTIILSWEDGMKHEDVTMAWSNQSEWSIDQKRIQK